MRGQLAIQRIDLILQPRYGLHPFYVAALYRELRGQIFEDMRQDGGNAVSDGWLLMAVHHVERIADSCGYCVPLMSYVAERPQRELWLERKGEQGIRDYVEERNAASIDGLPAFADEPALAD